MEKYVQLLFFPVEQKKEESSSSQCVKIITKTDKELHAGCMN